MNDKHLMTFSKLYRAILHTQFEMDMAGIKGTIDEVSVKYDTMEESMAFVGDMVGAGMKLSAQVNTEITYAKAGSKFVAHFDFLNHPGKPWRIEVMHIAYGKSPLHDHIASGEVVHTSWKVPWDQFYSRAADMVAKDYHMTLCENDYGLLAYFGNRPYLKMRAARPDA
jgi:hypothetical protein